MLGRAGNEVMRQDSTSNGETNMPLFILLNDKYKNIDVVVL